MDKHVAIIATYLGAFSTGDANRALRNSKPANNGLEAWRRLASECDPRSSMGRVQILCQIQKPPKCNTIEELGTALEDWLVKKNRYEEFTDKNGQSCRVADDSLLAAIYKLMPKTLEEQVLVKADEYDDFEELYRTLGSFAITKHSLKMHDKPVKTKQVNEPMEVDALGKARKAKEREIATTVANMDT